MSELILTLDHVPAFGVQLLHHLQRAVVLHCGACPLIRGGRHPPHSLVWDDRVRVSVHGMVYAQDWPVLVAPNLCLFDRCYHKRGAHFLVSGYITRSISASPQSRDAATPEWILYTTLVPFVRHISFKRLSYSVQPQGFGFAALSTTAI